MLLHRHRIIGAALDRRIVGDDHRLAALDPADPGDQPGAVHVALVHAEGGERADFEKRRAGIDKTRDALARQQLAARDMALARLAGAALGRGAPTGALISSTSCATRPRSSPRPCPWRSGRSLSASSRPNSPVPAPDFAEVPLGFADADDCCLSATHRVSCIVPSDLAEGPRHCCSRRLYSRHSVAEAIRGLGSSSALG